MAQSGDHFHDCKPNGKLSGSLCSQKSCCAFMPSYPCLWEYLQICVIDVHVENKEGIFH